MKTASIFNVCYHATDIRTALQCMFIRVWADVLSLKLSVARWNAAGVRDSLSMWSPWGQSAAADASRTALCFSPGSQF